MVNPLAIVKRVPVFFDEVKAELMKVSWPTRKDLLGATWIVTVTTALLTVFIGIIDFILSKAVSVILK